MYKIKDNILWRNEMNSFMLLHPISKKLLVFPKYISDNISEKWFIKKILNKNENFIDFLKKEELLEISILDIENEQFGSKKLSAPLNVTLQITDKCNLKCIHCHRKDKWVLDLPIDKTKSLIDELREMKVFNINISWWEALMHPNVYTILEYGFSKWLKMTMSTNWTLLNEEKIEKLYKIWLRQVHISMDSYLSDNHDKIRWVKNSLLKTLSNLKLLKKYWISFTLVTTLINQSYDEYKKIIDFSYKLWSNAHKTNLMISQWQGTDLEVNYYENSKVLDNYVQIFKIQREKYKNKMNVIWESMFLISIGENIIDNDKNKPDILKLWCPAWFTTSAITELWEVLPCPFFSELEVWNINNDSFKNIWNNSTILNKIRNRDDIKWCNTCSFKSRCWWCRARVFWIEWKIDTEDKYCFKNIY
jgi:radical SAM protein with 4Fe4S-binding SPASM domain